MFAFARVSENDCLNRKLCHITLTSIHSMVRNQVERLKGSRQLLYYYNRKMHEEIKCCAALLHQSNVKTQSLSYHPSQEIMLEMKTSQLEMLGLVYELICITN